MNRTSVYFFVIAALVSLVEGSFVNVSLELQIATKIILVFSGIFIGLFLFEYEKEFLISSIGFILAGMFLSNNLGEFFIHAPFGKILSNFVLFFSASTITIALKEMIDYIFKSGGVEQIPHEGVTIHHFSDSSFEKIWGITIIVAVAISLIQVFLEIFYNMSAYLVWIEILDMIIISLFFVDLMILYEKANTLKQFFTRNIFDIVAIIPSVRFLRMFKIIRATRIIKVFKSTTKLAKLIRVTKRVEELPKEKISYVKSVKKKSLKRKTKSKSK